MGSFTDAWEVKINDKVWGGTNFTVPATYYIGLSTTTITEAGTNITEPIGNAYARVSYSNVPASFAPSSGSPKTNALAIQFPTVTGGGWGTILAWFICDDPASVANVVSQGALPAPMTVIAGNGPNWPVGTFTFDMD